MLCKLASNNYDILVEIKLKNENPIIILPMLPVYISKKKNPFYFRTNALLNLVYPLAPPSVMIWLISMLALIKCLLLLNVDEFWLCVQWIKAIINFFSRYRVHSVEFLRFFCHLEYTWNQFRHFEASIWEIFKIPKNQKSKPSKSFWLSEIGCNYISRKIRVAGKFLAFHTV